MIQGLLSGARERKISINGGILLPPTPSPNSLPSSSSPSSTTTVAAAAAAASNSENQNLRCPRCDSSNTKFCYYNNYNLTQPRHFCKTCRRYWTKGGALRNVPIGGGCRKNKNVAVSNSAAKATTTKMKTVASSELVRSSGLGPGFVHELPTSPILWGSPQNTHLLALLKASQNQNPNPSSMSFNDVTNGVLNPRTLGYEYEAVEQVPSSVGFRSSFWRNNQNQGHQQNSGFVLGEHYQNSGIQELYRKLRSSSSANYCSDISVPMFMGNMASSSSSLSNILESPSVTGGELGSWNPTISWSDLQRTNGAYP